MTTAKLTKEKFIEFLETNVRDKYLPVYMKIKANTGWEFELSAAITDIVFEPEDYNTAFVSNAFSDKESVMSTDGIIARTLEADDCEYIAFEIYALDGRTNINEQIVSTYSTDLSVNQDELSVTINITVEALYNIKEPSYVGYIIHKDIPHVKWDGKTILFNTKEEVIEFMEAFPSEFKNLEQFTIFPERKELYNMCPHINYKDIKDTDAWKEEIEDRRNGLI